jgi:tRNA A-37 threonylcarbamoyl transferase component Bud32
VSQINWLHENNISHGDLELKNILLACDQSRAVIIDFEKSKQDASAENKARDKETLLAAIRRLLPGFEATMTSMLSGRVRRASFGGTRHTLHKKKHTRKIRKTQKHKGKRYHE